MSTREKRIQQSKDYLANHVDKYMNKLVVEILKQKPDDVLLFMQEWINREIQKREDGTQTQTTFKSEPQSVPVEPVDANDEEEEEKEAPAPGSEDDSDYDEEEDEIGELPPLRGHLEKSESDKEDEDAEDMEEIRKRKQKNLIKQRASVSAEAYGVFNRKKSYVPVIIAKAAEVKEKIRTRLTQAFMFSNLDEKEKNIVINAMEECKFVAGDFVIKQGDDGDCLYVVESGKLKCQRRMNKDDAEDTYLKTYVPGEAFGELALLYNAPRAASIIAEDEAVCYKLDRDCFNNIVKESAIKRRQRYDEFVQKIELLQELDAFERGKLTDALVTENYKKDDVIVKEGEKGDKFYFIEEGTAIALKDAAPEDADKEPKIVYEYKENDYFGELALLREANRAASIKVTSDTLVVGVIDRFAFKRLLGPLEELLSRNQDKYKKYEEQAKAEQGK